MELINDEFYSKYFVLPITSSSQLTFDSKAMWNNLDKATANVELPIFIKHMFLQKVNFICELISLIIN